MIHSEEREGLSLLALFFTEWKLFLSWEYSHPTCISFLRLPSQIKHKFGGLEHQEMCQQGCYHLEGCLRDSVPCVFELLLLGAHVPCFVTVLLQPLLPSHCLLCGALRNLHLPSPYKDM